MVLGTNREDLEVLVASVTGEGRLREVEKERGDEGGTRPRTQNWRKVGRIGFGVTGQS